jgi:ribosomal protein S18 acetylase RimI-like enzyme
LKQRSRTLMKLLTRWFLLLVLCVFYTTNTAWKVRCKDGSIVVVSVCKENLEKECNVFNKSFMHAYQDTEIELMILKKYKNLSSFLNEVFEDEKTDFNFRRPYTLFISAKDLQGRVIGFASFDKKSDHIYIRNLAIDPRFQKLGLGSLLMYSFVNIWKNVARVILCTRRLN